ncbi:MAG TPA: hypothetical protein VM077_00940 [Candidatus Limnocylindrales bacterium]|nr:hypothetical protein [Candidatus Limnocylindrales bacterium]
MQHKILKPSFLLKFLGVFIILLSFYFMQRIVVTPGDNQTLYEKAKKACSSEIYLLVNDIGPVTGAPIKSPFPEKIIDVTNDIIIDYSCNQTDILKKASQAQQNFHSFFG